MSNVQRLQQLIGRTGNVVITGQAGIKFGVRVLDARTVYSNIQVFCEPITGSGGKWYAISSVEFHEPIQQEDKQSC